PIFNEYTLYLSFVPILFLGRYTNMFYTVLSAFIVGLVNVLIGDYTIITAMIFIVIAGIIGAIGPFLKQSDIISLQILNVIALVIFAILSLISPYYEITEVLFLIPISFVLTITSS
ncbi:LytS/YhcK type 5TM receptor domain-containing protein, partial [Staphylococcus aureus]|nr:LytS/YhcK type 5TM receptor domain-containing protein [Staphylococcus aureus]